MGIQLGSGFINHSQKTTAAATQIADVLPRVESDWYSARYVETLSFNGVPPLLWTIDIQTNGDVVIDHVEEFEDY